MKYLLLFFSLLLLNCSVFLYNKPIKFNKKLPVCSDPQSGLTYEEFVLKANHPLRARNLIESKMAAIYNSIKPFLLTHDTIFINNNCNLSFNISPKGHISLNRYNDTLKLQPVLIAETVNLLSNIRFDSIPEYHVTTVVTVMAIMNNKTLSFDSTIHINFTSSGRSRESIMRNIMQYISTLRNEYNKRLHEKRGIAGTITVKYCIDEKGDVVYSNIIKTTINDSYMDSVVISWIRSLQFCSIYKPGDMTEVTYPFSFSQ